MLRNIKLIKKEVLKGNKILHIKYAGNIYSINYILFDDIKNYLKKIDVKRKERLCYFLKQVEKELIRKEENNKKELAKIELPKIAKRYKIPEKIIVYIEKTIDEGNLNSVEFFFSNGLIIISGYIPVSRTKWRNVFFGYLYRNSWHFGSNDILKLHKFSNKINFRQSLIDRKVIKNNYEVIKLVDLLY